MDKAVVKNHETTTSGTPYTLWFGIQVYRDRIITDREKSLISNFNGDLSSSYHENVTVS